MYPYLFRQIKKIIPPLSETERIALRSGGVDIDGQIFRGTVKKQYQLPLQRIHEVEHIQPNVERVLQKIGSNNIYPSIDIQKTLQTNRIRPKILFSRTQIRLILFFGQKH